MTAVLNAEARARIVEEAKQTTGTPAELDALAVRHGLLFSELLEVLKQHTGRQPGPAPRRGQAAAPDSKACTNCQETKPLGEFYPDDNNRDGRASWCRTCNNRRQPTQTRMLRNRARNRASAALVKAHPDEFERLYAIEFQKAEVEHQRLVTAAAGRPDADVARLKPGPKRSDEDDVTQRLDVARCPSCHTHHDDKHVCPNCGDETPAEPEQIKPYMIRAWAVAEGLGPVPSRGPLPARIVAAYHDAHQDQAAAS